MTILEKILTWVPDISIIRLIDNGCPYDLLCNTNEYCDRDSSCDCRDCWMQPFNEKTHCKVGNFDSIVDKYIRDDLDREIERIETDAELLRLADKFEEVGEGYPMTSEEIRAAISKYDEQLKKAGEVAEEAPVPGTEEPKKPMTCKEMFEKCFPDFKNDINEYCPSDFNFAGVPDYCVESESAATEAECERCWNREVKEDSKLTIEKAEILDSLRFIRHTFPDKPTIKDSGARREFETGAVRDIQEGKGRCDLLPLDVVGYMLNNTAINNISQFVNTNDCVYLYRALSTSNLHDTCHTMFLEVSKHFEDGAKKYGEYNWQKGIPTHCYIDSAVRHYLKCLRGDKDEPHDRAFVWNILCCIWTCIHKPELNDYAKKENE